jgi:hypothetical protein
MGAVYWRLLEKLEWRQFNVFAPALAGLNRVEKTVLVLRAGLRLAFGATTPDYGTP